MQVEPVTLVGKIVRLEPLSAAHIPGLAKVGLDPKIWRYMRYGRVDTETQLGSWVRELLELQARGTDLPFTVIHQDTGNPIGCTRYLDIDRVNHAVEIGGTWYGLKYQGTLVNGECKYLLLRYAFEELGCIRVWFKTDLRNKRSQYALESLGAVKEGVLRHHMLLPDGYIRDSVVYSILPDEWPAIKLKLEAKLRSSKGITK
jgi:N-acetyltransferase